jgi:cell division protein FtsQ
MPDIPPTLAETFADKQPTQPRKRRPNWKALLFVVVFFGGLLVAGYLQSPLSTVSTIEVKGIHQVRYEEILRAAGIQQGMSFWRIRKGDVADKIHAAFPLIESADVQVSWTGEVVIAVAEKSVAGLLHEGNKFYRLLQDGTVLEASGKEESTLPVISMDNPPSVKTGARVTTPELLELAKQMPEVERKILDQISEIRITAEGPWKIYMRDRFEVRIPPRLFADKMKGYDKYRNALGADAKPGIISLQESEHFEPYQPAKKKGGE